MERGMQEKIKFNWRKIFRMRKEKLQNNRDVWNSLIFLFSNAVWSKENIEMHKKKTKNNRDERVVSKS